MPARAITVPLFESEEQLIPVELLTAVPEVAVMLVPYSVPRAPEQEIPVEFCASPAVAVTEPLTVFIESALREEQEIPVLLPEDE